MPGPAEREPDDADPTGIRELLAGLPDPGPMPDDLVRRIEARLEVEQTAREQESSRPLGRHADRVLDLATERGSRRPVRTVAWLGVAAAGLVATAAVVPQLVDGLGGTGSGDTAAYYPSAREDAADDAGVDSDMAGGAEEEIPDEPGTLSAPDEDGTDRESAADGDAGASPELRLVPLDGELVLLADLGRVEAQTLTQTLLLAVEEHDTSGTQPPRLSGVLTEGEATSCWRGLADARSFDRYVAAPAHALRPDGQRQGEAVVALLGLDEDGSARSWVMPESCTDQPDTVPVAEGEPHD